ncbi:MAG: LicD family protein [Kiritimatiellae bacterium]|nr:LicD family protein [Kiritimatiellia bacterium]
MATTYREYDPETLAHLQDVLRGMLDDFAALCARHGLRWWVDYGAAIGALRHKGMIPWDDDIDICLLREDYDAVLKLVESELGDKYYVLDAERYPAYPLMTARICLKGTKFREESMRGVDAPFGIFLDIYCFDNLADDPREARRQWRHAWFWNKLKIMREIRSPVIYVKGPQRLFIRSVCFLFHYAVLILFSRDYLNRKTSQWARLHQNESTVNVFYPFYTIPFRHSMRRDAIFPTRLVPFDGRNVPLANCAEVLLQKAYGDYMTIPSPENRHNHPPIELDFGLRDA